MSFDYYIDTESHVVTTQFELFLKILFVIYVFGISVFVTGSFESF